MRQLVKHLQATFFICISLLEVARDKQKTACTHSFGHPVIGRHELGEDIAEFASCAAEMLRRQGSVSVSAGRDTTSSTS